MTEREEFHHTAQDRADAALLLLEIEKRVSVIKNNLLAVHRKPSNSDAARQIFSSGEQLLGLASGLQTLTYRFAPTTIYTEVCADADRESTDSEVTF